MSCRLLPLSNELQEYCGAQCSPQRMKMEDFCAFYAALDICYNSPNFMDEDEARLWNCSVKEGLWKAGKSAGGCDYSTGTQRLFSNLSEDQEPVIFSELSEMRELIGFYFLDPGEYFVVPCTFDSIDTASFIISIYSKTEAEIG